MKNRLPVIDSSLLSITAFVLSIHLLAYLWIAFFDQTTPKPLAISNPKRLIVQTIGLQRHTPPPPPKHTTLSTTRPSPPLNPKTEASTAPKTTHPPTVKPSPKSPPTPKTPPKPTPPSPSKTPKKTPPKPITTPKVSPQKPEKKSPPEPSKPEPKTHVKQVTNEDALKKEEQKAQAQAIKKRQQALISQAQERIAKIAPAHDKLDPNRVIASLNTPLPPPISSLKVDDVSEDGTVPLNDRETNYRDELAIRMKLWLRLPEYGDVKMNLTLDRTGKVIKVAIISAQSINNRNYIEKTIPSLSFPAFGNQFGSETQHTFSITFSNDL